MSNGPRITIDLIVVATLVALVAKEMNGCVIDSAGQVLLVLHMSKTESFVPAGRKGIEGDLAADRVSMPC